MLSTAPPKGTNVVIVGHAYRFYSLVGGRFLEEGETVIGRPNERGFRAIARVAVFATGLGAW